MPNEQFNLTVIAPADRFHVCVDYLFGLFSQTSNNRVTVIKEEASVSPGSQLIIYYGMQRSANPFRLPSIQIERSPFWGTGFGNTPSAPAGFDELVEAAGEYAFKTVSSRSGDDITIHHDIIAAAFYLLSGYHDWVSKQRDKFGRVLSTDVPVNKTTWDRPVVNHWLRQLDELIRNLITGQSFESSAKLSAPRQQTICLTHDVDLLHKYKTAKMPRHLIRSLKAGTFKKEWAESRAVLSGRKRDPYDSFDQLYTIKERVSAPSTYFFLTESGAKNSDYKITDRETRNLIIRAKNFGDEIALHGSWESGNDPARLVVEKQFLERVTGNGTVKGSRQHYLRFQTPEIWSSLANAGIQYDSSGGFPDRSGFKYGWSGCFRAFDLNAMAPSDTIEIPVICMDVTLASYEKIPAELALERLTNLLDASCDNVPGGAFVFLWHNIMGDRTAYPGYWDTFEYFFSIASGSARFITLSQLCSEFEISR